MREVVEWDTGIREPLASFAPGAAVLVLVEGEAGMGKTRFVRWLLGLPELGRMPRLTVAFTASGASVHEESARPTGTAQPRPAARTCASLGELPVLIGARAPTLLVAENVHRADEQDARALRAVLAHPPAGLRAVLTYRPEELAHRGLVLGAPAGYPAELAILRLRLGPLTVEAVREMAVAALGEERCPTRFVTRLHERSGGIAQVVADLVTELKTAGPPADGSAKAVGRHRLTAADVDEATVPVRLMELVVGRMATLDEKQQRVVSAAAVLDAVATEDELISVAALSTGGRAALIAALSPSLLHEVGPGRYGFRVPMESAAVYQLLPGPVRWELHGRAAEALTARRPVPWERLARHQLASGRIADWLESVENAAREAAESGDHQLTISLIEDTLAHPEVPPSERARLARILTRSANDGLGSDRTAKVLRRLADDPALPTVVRGEIRLNLGIFLYNQVGRGRDGRAEVAKAAEELSDSSPVLAARAMATLAMPFLTGVPLAENLAWLARAEATAAESGDAVVQAAFASNRSSVLCATGNADGWRHVARLPRKCDDPRILRYSIFGLANAAELAVWLGEYARARELTAECVSMWARCKQPYWEQSALVTSMHLDLRTGQWAGLADRARTLVAEAGGPRVSNARLVLGLLALAKGEWDQVDTHLSGSELLGDDANAHEMAAASGGRIRLALARHDPAAATREGAEAWARLQAKGVWVWAAELAPWAVEATFRAGDLDTARQMVDKFAAGIAGRQAPAATAALTWCRAMLAEADGELQEAAEHFQLARTHFQALPRPYEAALTAEAGARCALAGGWRISASISQLDAAARELGALGAAWDVARVRAELRNHQPAERRRPGRPSYGERLSPREQEVAALAGAGMSNREIATTLHLSPRTVEQHVARALRKLGAASRRDLALLDRNSEPPG